MISAVVPCYNEEESLPLFVRELTAVAQIMRDRFGEEMELVLVDDGSADKTPAVFKDIEERAVAGELPFAVTWLSFSRNFGKEAALYAGLSRATGECVATMDADLQDPPSLLPQMYEYLQTGEYDNVATRRTDRSGEPPIRSFFAHLFYRLINKISDTEIVDGARDFRLMTRKMVDAVLSMTEYNRFSKGMFSWVGFRTKWLAYENVERAAGATKWSFFSLLLYSLDGIVGFSTAPLALASVIGIALCFIAFVAGVVIVAKTLAFGDPVSGWPSLATIMVFLGGLQLLSLGIIGQYLAKAYLEIKHRPIYIARDEGDSRKRVSMTDSEAR